LILDDQPFADFRTTTPVMSLADFAGDAELFSDPITGQLRLSLESDTLTARGTRIAPGPNVKKGMIELPTNSSGKSATSLSVSATKGTLDPIASPPAPGRPGKSTKASAR
jgi:hypothetical protein